MSQASPNLLRYALLADALASGGTGLLLAVVPLDSLLGLPDALLRPGGAFLLAFAATVRFIGTRPVIPRLPAGLVAIGNGLWSVGSLILLASPALSPTGLGQAFVLFQAAIVASLAVAQAAGLRRETAALAA